MSYGDALSIEFLECDLFNLLSNKQRRNIPSKTLTINNQYWIHSSVYAYYFDHNYHKHLWNSHSFHKNNHQAIYKLHLKGN